MTAAKKHQTDVKYNLKKMIETMNDKPIMMPRINVLLTLETKNGTSVAMRYDAIPAIPKMPRGAWMRVLYSM
jgi:hypothetical protein